MNTIKIFENDDFGAIKTIMINGIPYFVGKDVANVLGYRNLSDALMRHTDEDDRKTLKYKAYRDSRLADLWDIASNDFSDKTVINESGLYSLIFGSELESARKFKRWVTSEVLPSIRKHGGYIDGQEHMSIDEINEKYLQVLASITKEKEALTEKVEALSEAYEQEKARREELKEDLRIYENAEHNMTLGEFAALLRANGRKETRSKFFENLRKSGFLYSDDDRWNYPKEENMSGEYPFFTVREYEYNGEECFQTLLTPEGQKFFIWLLLKRKGEK